MKILSKILLLQFIDYDLEDAYYRIWFNGSCILLFKSIDNKKEIVNYPKRHFNPNRHSVKEMICCYKYKIKKNIEIELI